MKKILIALDYNPSAQKVAEAGYELARSMKAQVFLLHVISDPTYYSSLSYSPIMGFGSFSAFNFVETETKDEIARVAQSYLKKSALHLGDDKIKTIVRNGYYGEAILETASEINADIIVMGTHSRRGLDKILMGSVAEKVLHHSPLPVFIIPTREIDQGRSHE